MEKKLYRSRTDKMIGGVAGGLGEYFGFDPVIARIVFVLLTIYWGSGVLLYIIAWIVIPEEPVQNKNTKKEKEGEISQKVNQAAAKVKESLNGSPAVKKGRMLGGLVLIALGFLLLGQMFFPELDGKILFGALLILIGFFVLSGRR